MSEHSGPSTLSLALRCVFGVTVDGNARPALLTLVRTTDDEPGRKPERPRVVPFPGPRRPADDGPSAA